MRQYLRIDEKWKDWDGMEMQWIHHHNPDLVVLDDNGKEKELLAEEKKRLQADSTFQAFKAKVEQVPLGQHVEVARVMLTALHAAGLLFLQQHTALLCGVAHPSPRPVLLVRFGCREGLALGLDFLILRVRVRVRVRIWV